MVANAILEQKWESRYVWGLCFINTVDSRFKNRVGAGKAVLKLGVNFKSLLIVGAKNDGS
jgi:hypothetical protein